MDDCYKVVYSCQVISKVGGSHCRVTVMNDMSAWAFLCILYCCKTHVCGEAMDEVWSAAGKETVPVPACFSAS